MIPVSSLKMFNTEELRLGSEASVTELVAIVGSSFLAAIARLRADLEEGLSSTRAGIGYRIKNSWNMAHEIADSGQLTEIAQYTQDPASKHLWLHS